MGVPPPPDIGHAFSNSFSSNSQLNSIFRRQVIVGLARSVSKNGRSIGRFIQCLYGNNFSAARDEGVQKGGARPTRPSSSEIIRSLRAQEFSISYISFKIRKEDAFMVPTTYRYVIRFYERRGTFQQNRTGDIKRSAQKSLPATHSATPRSLSVTFQACAQRSATTNEILGKQNREGRRQSTVLHVQVPLTQQLARGVASNVNQSLGMSESSESVRKVRQEGAQQSIHSMSRDASHGDKIP